MAPRRAEAPGGTPEASKTSQTRAQLYPPRVSGRKVQEHERGGPKRIKAALVAVLSRFPVALWPLAGAVARAVWPSFRGA